MLADDSFVAWIEGTATQEVTAKWEAWLENDPARKEQLKEAKLLHRNLKLDRNCRPEMEEELFKLKKAATKLERTRNLGKEARTLRTNRKNSYRNIAAVIILLLAVSGVIAILQPDLFQFEASENATAELITLSTQNGQQKVLTLSDGSTVSLNSNSTLKYPATYSKGDLDVWLEGEAYFDVVHETGTNKRTFSVHVPGGGIEVLGTKFNVNTYEEDTEVVLVQGRVNIEREDSLGQITDSYRMQPGELSRISQDSKGISTKKIEAEIYTSWTQGKLMFDHTPLTKVVERIQHIYGVRFQLNGHDLKETLISGSLPNSNLEVFLNTLEHMVDYPVTYKDGLVTLGE